MFTIDPYMLKVVEYLTCLLTVALFAAFWTFAQGDASPAHARVQVRAEAPAWSGHLVDWFRLPEGYAFHPGHAWAKREMPAVALVGMDDFAQQLVGPLKGIDLPRRGEVIRAGQHAMRLRADSKTVDMLAPVSGTVLAVNELIETKPQLANEDPFGRGWLYAVKLASPKKGLDELIGGAAARAWMEQVTRDLEMTFTPELGHVLQDGGHPVHGFAQAIDQAGWDRVAKKFLLS
jgi:glycine cleavage system H lipoate-binding protein